MAANIRKSRLRESPGSDESSRATTEWSTKLQRGFLRWLEQRCSRVEMLGIPGGEPLSARLDDLFVPPYVSIRPARALGVEATLDETDGERHEKTAPPEQGSSGIGTLTDLLALRRQIALVGGPGAGKSLLLNDLAGQLARKGLGGNPVRPPDDLRHEGALVPILVPLGLFEPFCRVFTRTRPEGSASVLIDFAGWTLERAAGDSAPGKDVIGELARRYRIVLLLDGLDEVGDVRYQRILCSSVLDLVMRYPGTPLLLTTRPTVFEEARVVFPAPPFLEAELLPFDREQRRAFADKWSQAISGIPGERPPAEMPQSREHAAQDLMSASTSAPWLENLTSNPLLLTVLAVLLEEASQPRVLHIELLERVTNTLLHSWDEAKMEPGTSTAPPYATLSVDAQRCCVAALALAGRVKGLSEIPADVALDVLQEELLPLTGSADRAKEQAHELLEHLSGRGGLLVIGDRGYRFRHACLQEFLAAWDLSLTPEPRTLRQRLESLPDGVQMQEILSLLSGIWANQGATERANELERILEDLRPNDESDRSQEAASAKVNEETLVDLIYRLVAARELEADFLERPSAGPLRSAIARLSSQGDTMSRIPKVIATLSTRQPSLQPPALWKAWMLEAKASHLQGLLGELTELR